MNELVAAAAAPGQIEYLDQAARSAIGRDYKHRLLDALDPRPGHVVLDIGCGPGTDLPALAAAVGDEGHVVGVDHDSQMLAAARLRLSRRRNVTLCRADAHALGCADGCFDRARADRVLQHVADPVRTLAELHRVLRPGGVLTLAEPDWDTLAIDDEDLATSRTFTQFVVGGFRHPTIGRQLVRLTTQVGFQTRSVEVTPAVFRDVDAAEQILGLRRNAGRAVRAGDLTPDAARRWLDRLASAEFLAYFTFIMVAVTA